MIFGRYLSPLSGKTLGLASRKFMDKMFFIIDSSNWIFYNSFYLNIRRQLDRFNIIVPNRWKAIPYCSQSKPSN
jgi:hypothetical protein